MPTVVTLLIHIVSLPWPAPTSAFVFAFAPTSTLPFFPILCLTCLLWLLFLCCFTQLYLLLWWYCFQSFQDFWATTIHFLISHGLRTQYWSFLQAWRHTGLGLWLAGWLIPKKEGFFAKYWIYCRSLGCHIIGCDRVVLGLSQFKSYYINTAHKPYHLERSQALKVSRTS